MLLVWLVNNLSLSTSDPMSQEPIQSTIRTKPSKSSTSRLSAGISRRLPLEKSTRRESRPWNPSSRGGPGWCCGGRSVLAAAITCLLTLVPPGCASRPVSHYNAGVALHQSGRLPDAIHAYKRSIQLAPRDPRPRFNLAVLYQDQGKTLEAQRAYEELLETHPGHAPAWANLGAIHEEQGRLGCAEESFRHAMEVDRDDPFVAGQYGFFLLRQSRLAEAESQFQEAIRRDARCANGYFGLGSVALRRGEDVDALRAFQNALRYNPKDRAAHLEAANLLRRQDKPVEALRHLRKASSMEPRQPDILFQLGCALKAQGAWKEAEEALQEALKLGAPEADCHRELSTIYRSLASELERSLPGAQGVGSPTEIIREQDPGSSSSLIPSCRPHFVRDTGQDRGYILPVGIHRMPTAWEVIPWQVS